MRVKEKQGTRTGRGGSGLWHAVKADTPFGPIRGLVSGDTVDLSAMKADGMEQFLEWGRRRLGDDAHITVDEPDSAMSQRFRIDVERLLHGRSASFTPDLSRNTSFQIEVAQAVLKIPFGSTASYGDVAVAVGKPGGAQAVGQALPRLPYALFIPSHRVVKVDGDSIGCTLLTFDLKTGLLQWERDQAGQALP